MQTLLVQLLMQAHKLALKSSGIPKEWGIWFYFWNISPGSRVVRKIVCEVNLSTFEFGHLSVIPKSYSTALWELIVKKTGQQEDFKSQEEWDGKKNVTSNVSEGGGDVFNCVLAQL